MVICVIILRDPREKLDACVYECLLTPLSQKSEADPIANAALFALSTSCPAGFSMDIDKLSPSWIQEEGGNWGHLTHNPKFMYHFLTFRCPLGMCPILMKNLTLDGSFFNDVRAI